MACALSFPVMLLCPDYHQVTQFGPDDNYKEEEEEEIFYITLKLGNIEPVLIPSCDSYHLVVSPFLCSSSCGSLYSRAWTLRCHFYILLGRCSRVGTRQCWGGNVCALGWRNPVHRKSTIFWPLNMKTQYPIGSAHSSRAASEKCESKRRPKPTLANLCWIALLGNSHLYHTSAGLERWRSSQRISVSSVHV